MAPRNPKMFYADQLKLGVFAAKQTVTVDYINAVTGFADGIPPHIERLGPRQGAG